MYRGLIVGGLAFAAAFAAERLITAMGPDIARYEKMRKMSNQPTLRKELLGMLGGVLGGSVGANGSVGFVAAMTNDLVRYAQMRGM